ncbi:MAG: transporter [Jatrophihabitantaceae bacterium]|nr:transporter [Jatrophihabitantaceae bacterium]
MRGQHPVSTPPSALSRRLGLGDAVLIGMGSMIGAGIFASFAPAAQAAGSGLLIGLGIAALIAYCNAVSSAQLAAVYPVSGGTYVYGRERLGPWWGFAAGWGFVIGKTASCAAMALTFAAYALPGPEWVQRGAAVAAVLALAALNYRGVTRTALLTRVLVTVSLVVLGAWLIAVAIGPRTDASRLGGWSEATSGGVYGLLQSAGLLFFAFAGYARIATMGEEVRDPARTIPRAIQFALGGVVLLYALVGVTALMGAGPMVLADSTAPLADAARAAGSDWIAPWIRVGAAVASLGALLGLIAGVGRTALAMAREGDLPRWLDAVHPRYAVPHRAEMALAAVVSAIVLLVDVRGAIGFSSFAILLYYAIANAAAFTQPRDERRWPRAVNVVGGAGCLVLVAALPWESTAAGAAVIGVGLVGRVIRLRHDAPD